MTLVYSGIEYRFKNRIRSYIVDKNRPKQAIMMQRGEIMPNIIENQNN